MKNSTFKRKVTCRLRGLIIKLKSVKCKNVSIRNNARVYCNVYRGAIQGRGVLLLNPNSINNKEYLKLRIDRGGQLCIQGRVSFFTNTNIHVGRDAILRVGDGTYINEGTKISIRSKVTIGANCAISNDVTILDSDFHRIIGRQESVDTGIEIGNHVWVGANSTILKNVKIGNDCIIGANSVVLHDIPKGCVAVGNPARVVRRNCNWK